jgi:hypothetical protein
MIPGLGLPAVNGLEEKGAGLFFRQQEKRREPEICRGKPKMFFYLCAKSTHLQ